MTDDALRARIGERLRAGLRTECTSRAYSSEAVTTVCQRLQQLPQEDLDARLVTAGFTLEPWVDQDASKPESMLESGDMLLLSQM